MRLINVNTLQLSEFFGDDIPPYAILSHRWRQEEVGFELFSSSLEEAKKLQGFKKIRYCAEQAERDGLSWCWVDTCCIDKRSSSELSEAINSMYAWYQNAACCYAYLDDVSAQAPGEYFARFKEWEGDFLKSEWFLRGWTLQELIAPRNLRFYSEAWVEMGAKNQLAGSISRQFRIDERILLGRTAVDKVAVAQRMRWASGRKTTRVEDTAYCLLGIFDVNMPLLYGEGQKAFLRLQEEITKRSDDHSIFSWIDRTATRTTFRGLYARSPREFQHCHRIEFKPRNDSEPFAETNRGLKIWLRLHETDDGEFEYLASLNCSQTQGGKGVAIRLRRTHQGSNQFMRVDPYRLWDAVYATTSSLQQLYVPGKIPVSVLQPEHRVAGFKLALETSGVTVQDVWPADGWRKEDYLIRIDPHDKEQQRLFTARIMLQDLHKASGSGKNLIVLVYNPQSGVAFDGVVSGHSLQPGDSRGYAGKPADDYQVSEVMSPGRVEWLPQGERLGRRVKTEMEFIGDEVMIVANIRIARETDSPAADPASDLRRRRSLSSIWTPTPLSTFVPGRHPPLSYSHSSGTPRRLDDTPAVYNLE